MKFRIRLLSLLLAGLLALSLAACTGGEDAETVSASPTLDATDSSESVLPDDFVVDTSVADLCLATADIPGDFALFTVNGVPVTASAYLYWLSYNISYLSSVYGVEIDWSSAVSDLSFADYIKEDSLNAAVCYSLVASKAQELGCELTEEQISELESNLALTAAMMGGEDSYEDWLRKMGLDRDTFYQINAAPYYYQQLMAGLYDEPTDEEMDAYIAENDILRAKHILLATVDLETREPLDDATIAEKKATAESLLAQLQASTDLLTDFDALMNEYSEDPGLASNPDGYVFTAGDMVEAFETATRELEFGQISGLVESSTTGYHIILRLDPDTEDTRLQYRADLLDAQMQTWLDEADVIFTDEYEALDPRMFYEKYTAYQNAFTAQAEEDSADASSEDSAEASQEN